MIPVQLENEHRMELNQMIIAVWRGQINKVEFTWNNDLAKFSFGEYSVIRNRESNRYSLMSITFMRSG